eukprot:gene10695-14362_t
MVGNVANRVENMELLRFDLTSGATSVSTYITVQNRSQFTQNLFIPDKSLNSNEGLLKVHQIGRKFLRKVPDEALLGALTLVATELIQREVSKQSATFPPLMQGLANNTLVELDNKLEMLTYLNWNMDPFIQNEMENLQTQPFEVFDKFIVSEVLSKVDREFSPIIAKLVGNPTKVKAITRNIKDLIQLLAAVNINVKSQNSDWQINPLEKTAENLAQNIESISVGIEGVINDWNKAIDDISKSIKVDNLKLKYLLSSGSLTPNANSTSSYLLSQFKSKSTNDPPK